jgi:hypothetical protein
MSQTSHLAWYTTASDVDAVHVLKHLPEIVGFARATDVFRTKRIVLAPEDEEPRIDIASNVLGSELFRLYVPGTCLVVYEDFAELGNRIEKVILDEVPRHVRGDFMPNRPVVMVGKHYLYDNAYDRAIATPTVTIECWCDTLPTICPETERLIAESKGLRAEKTKLEHLLGDVKQTLYYSI